MLLGHYGNKLAVFILFALIARVAGDAVIGQYAIASTYSVFAFLIVSFGIDKLIERQIAVRELDPDDAIVNAVLTQLVLWLPIALLLVLLPKKIFNLDVETANAVAVLAIWVLLTAIKSVFDGVFNGLEKLQFTSVLNVCSGFILLLVGTIAILLSPRVTSVALAMVIERSVTLALYLGLWININSSKKDVRSLRSWFDLQPVFSLLKLAAPFAIFAITASMFQRIDILILSFFVTHADIGHYATAYRFMDFLILIPGMLGVSFFPIISRTIQSDVSIYREVAASAIERGFIIMWPIVWILFFYSKDLIIQVFGDLFAPSSKVLNILIWGILVQVVNNILGRSIMAYRETDLIILGIVALASNVVINLLLVPIMGIYGAAWATIGSYVISMSVHIVLLSMRGVGIRYDFLIRPILVCAASAAVGYLFLTSHGREIAVLTSLGVYMTLAILLGYVPKSVSNKISHLIKIRIWGA